jgi:hypothetical protein
MGRVTAWRKDSPSRVERHRHLTACPVVVRRNLDQDEWHRFVGEDIP